MQGCQIVFQFRKYRFFQCKFFTCLTSWSSYDLHKRCIRIPISVRIFINLNLIIFHGFSTLKWRNESTKFLETYFFCFTSQNTDCGRHLPEGEDYVPFAHSHAACLYRNYSNLSFASFTRITQSNKRNSGFQSKMMHMQLL